MTRDEIFLRLQETMVELFDLHSEDITLAARLKEDLDLDSIDAIDMAARLHEITGRRLELESMKSIRTVSDVIDLIHAHVHAGA